MRLKYKDRHKTHYASGRTIIRLERSTTKGSSFGRIMRLLPGLYTWRRITRRSTKCLPKFVETDNATVVQKRPLPLSTSFVCCEACSQGLLFTEREENEWPFKRGSDEWRSRSRAKWWSYPLPLGGGDLEVRRVRRGTEEEKIKESQIYPQVTNNFTSEDLTLVFMG